MNRANSSQPTSATPALSLATINRRIGMVQDEVRDVNKRLDTLTDIMLKVLEHLEREGAAAELPTSEPEEKDTLHDNALSVSL